MNLDELLSYPIKANYTGWPPPKKKTEQSIQSIFQDFALINSYFFTLLDRAFFPHYNNTKIIKFGWELFILWVISYGLSFSGFARFPEFRDTINDSFSSTCANTYHYSTRPATNISQCQWRAWIVNPCHWTLWWSLLGNTRITEHNTRSAEAVINRASELWKSGKSRKWQSISNYS